MIDLFCIASGPSLTKEDCDLVKKSGIKTIAVNNTWEMVPWCDYIYGGDKKWWDIYHDKITSGAQRWTCSTGAANAYKINYHIAGGSYNSGMRAVQFAVNQGYKEIALLGYDCSLKNGIHWHGEHDKTKLRNPTDEKVGKWAEQFERAAKMAKLLNANVYNCSRYTELKSFPVVKLEDILNVN